MGIRENSSCFSNTIGNNNVNYYLDAPVVSAAKESTVGFNQGYAAAAHQVRSMGQTLQTFQPERTAEFIRRLQRDQGHAGVG
jgi:hypothetical protein